MATTMIFGSTPEQQCILINANDGGANVSFNAGKSWSSSDNQPTDQFYRVITDNQLPLLGLRRPTRQLHVATASAAPGGIGWKDWHAVSGCESAYLAFDPDDPKDVYGGCYQGLIDVWNRESGESEVDHGLSVPRARHLPRDQKYRFNWNAPIVASPHDPTTIYHAGNVVFKTTDKGQSWQQISPDLTRNEVEKQGPGGGPITNEGAGGENYNTIYYFVESPASRQGPIGWGRTTVLVHISRDGGQNWKNVTPEGHRRRLINSIDVSPHDPATAYIAVTQYKFNDFTPHILQDQRLRRKLDSESSRASKTKRGSEPSERIRSAQGLLYAGTELGMYISFDEGLAVATMAIKLPIVPITDLTIRNNDLVAATQGRAFWILDDLSPVQQITAETAEADVHLFEPRPAIQVQWGGRPREDRWGKIRLTALKSFFI